MCPTRVAVVLSGGVDSAIAVLLMLEGGYDVFGVTMRLWHGSDCADGPTTPSCDPILGGQRVASALGMAWHALDPTVPFREREVDRFIAEYSVGRTPNPCLYCNRQVKSGSLLQQATALGADCLATGHHTRRRWNAAAKRWRPHCAPHER